MDQIEPGSERFLPHTLLLRHAATSRTGYQGRFNQLVGSRNMKFLENNFGRSNVKS